MNCFVSTRLHLFFCCILLGQDIFASPEHIHELDNFIVETLGSTSSSNTALPVTVLDGDELRLEVAPTIGDSLKNQPGINNQSFGPGVGRPVIRGQSGSRTKVLQNGLNILDVSSLSPDHANSIESLWADRIEILRGPATLLYGSGTIGGVVNVLDQRIPDDIPDKALNLVAEQRYSTVNEGKSTGFKLDGGSNIWAWHLDGHYRDSADLSVPVGNGRLNNSKTRARSGTAGLSTVTMSGFFGGSINHIDNRYAIPSETTIIDMKQTRYDIKSELEQPFDFAEQIGLQIGFTDYEHTETEDASIGTIFSNEGFNSRIELVHRPWGFFDHGATGVQVKNSEYSAIGEEVVVPNSDIGSLAFFSVQDIHTDWMTYEIGFRTEHQWINSSGSREVSHTPVNFSSSILWGLNDEDAVRVSFSRSQRAPDVQELFANGLHLATSTYDIGNIGLTEETAYNLELGIHIDREQVQADINLFQSWAYDYITNIRNGQYYNSDTETFVGACSGNGCYPVYSVRQKKADFTGFEAQVNLSLANTNWGDLGSRIFGDYVRGRFGDDTDVPRMPPLRYGMELYWENDDWKTQIRMTRAENQSHPGYKETPTDGYWLLNASSSYRLRSLSNHGILVFIKGNNLLDNEIRNSVSYLRTTAPAPGIGMEVGLRVEI